MTQRCKPDTHATLPHWNVSLHDPEEAVEIIMLENYFHRIVDGEKPRRSPPQITRFSFAVNAASTAIEPIAPITIAAVSVLAMDAAVKPPSVMAAVKAKNGPQLRVTSGTLSASAAIVDA